MRDYLKSLVTQAPSPQAAKNAAREYLQARILEQLQRSGAFGPLAFQGGTSLRFLFQIPRFSEDLDFALERPGAGYDLRRLLAEIRSEFAREGYAPRLKISDSRAVHGAFVIFPGLPFEMGLSRRRDETLSIKLEVDTNPPPGARLEVSIVRRHCILRLQHHDRASLFAGKLHALLARPYAKGRDLYDLAWYLSDRSWPPPNLVLLNHALGQTGWKGQKVTGRSWRRLVAKRLQALNWPRLVSDALPFMERASDAEILTEETFKRLLAPGKR